MRIFDIHAHIYPDAIAQRVVRNLSAAYDGFGVRCDGRLDTLLKRMDAAGIERCAVHSVATAAHQAERINAFVMDSARTYGNRLMPFAAMHPDVKDPDAAADALAAAGFRGVKLHPEMQGFYVDEPRAVRLFGALAGRLPVLLHCGDYRSDHSAPGRIRRMLRQVTGLKLVCAHLGGWTQWEAAAAQLIGQDVWVDTSSSLYALDAATATGIVRGYGVERVLFGVDYPVFSPEEEVARFMELPLTEYERSRILWENHLSLLGGGNESEY